MKIVINKWIKIVCAIVCISVIIPCVFTSCDESKNIAEEIEDQFIGTWRYMEKTDSQITDEWWAFSENGAAKHVLFYTNNQVVFLEGTFEIKQIEDKWFAFVTLTKAEDNLGHTLNGLDNEMYFNLFYDEDNGNLIVQGPNGFLTKK
ncbi:MAG: hypothetical protein E7587_10405 [Ruminococcaceae bacterium]|nr:hypothetical protein [Oscillospiraceae bacterium]